MSKNDKCEICDRAVHHPMASFCRRCKKLLDRTNPRQKPNRNARVKALKEAWDGQGFRCYYTGIKLVEDNSKDPRYLTFDHIIPRKQGNIVIAASAINDMKSDMSSDEFRRMVITLANHFNGSDFDENAFKLKHWKRW
jgi:hypothetical protein